MNLIWYGINEWQVIPVYYRFYDKETGGKSNNNHFCDMLSLANISIAQKVLVFNAWYGGLKNLKAVRDHGWIWVTTLNKNRKTNRDICL